jgi:hypothetical protein
MIREVIKPQYTNFSIDIPANYINREVEFIMFPLDEKESIQVVKQKNNKSLRGVFNKYADNLKIDLENTAWKNHIIKKFK